ncbi:AfsR/SARP family transcriptional regulator (plasmid) [Streptomyces sp. BHT-5-2]|uniref:AfsR/SARP family transcriptional regulator n=1 Tax=Streptomyces sp. BHT-5-2 TaxID=2866715 RepID=UPI001C8E3DF0|nr:AfsR/SARP family transcriptional regulator [Streptomyces sp. BHT-5-2]QZL04212.1 AfsR/SARP family transcriptional regulator [Streptomyces sp. BHT-5-2]QZL08170.1 AfsR/SARP family transcriptional regulator [Streptomyces sp. BHT-5-2]
MRFEVTGPLRVVGDDGAAVALPRGRVRQLLTALLLQDGPVPETKLCEWLSQGTRPMAGSTLRTHIAALRRALGSAADRVRTVPAGYLIEVRTGELDLAEFRDLSSRGREALSASDYAAAGRLLRQAADLWRGPVLTDVPDSPDVWPLVMELDEERQLVAEGLVDARLHLGEHRELIPELRARASMDPPQERVVEQLMTALYRSGRRIEACDAYRRLRKLLAEAYGVEPGSAVERLHQRILADHSDLRLAGAMTA